MVYWLVRGVRRAGRENVTAATAATAPLPREYTDHALVAGDGTHAADAANPGRRRAWWKIFSIFYVIEIFIANPFSLFYDEFTRPGGDNNTN